MILLDTVNVFCSDVSHFVTLRCSMIYHICTALHCTTHPLLFFSSPVNCFFASSDCPSFFLPPSLPPLPPSFSLLFYYPLILTSCLPFPIFLSPWPPLFFPLTHLYFCLHQSMTPILSRLRAGAEMPPQWTHSIHEYEELSVFQYTDFRYLWNIGNMNHIGEIRYFDGCSNNRTIKKMKRLLTLSKIFFTTSTSICEINRNFFVKIKRQIH